MDTPLAMPGDPATVILVWIAHGLVLGTVLAGFTWLSLRILRNRVRPALEMVLWLVVLLKFLVPAGPICSTVLSAFVTQPVRDAAADFCLTEAAREGVGETGAMSGSVIATPPRHREARKKGLASALGFYGRQIVALYSVAFTALVLLRLWTHHRFAARCRLLPQADERTGKLVSDVCRRLGMRRIPSIRIGEDLPAPFVMGILHPMLVLTRRQLVRPDELETVVAHELAHFRRGDFFVRYFQWFAGSVLFFWPVIAWVNRRLDAARECACDEWALRCGKLTAPQYARCLLQAASPRRLRGIAYCPQSMAGNLTVIERRIDMILEKQGCQSPRYRWGLLTLAVLAAWSGLALTGAADVESAAYSPGGVRPATVEAVTDHAVELYELVSERGPADFDGDGTVTYLEKDVYLVAVAMGLQEAFMDQYPFADRNHSGILDFLEAYGVIRGITRIAYLDRVIGAEMESVAEPETDAGREALRAIEAKYAPDALALLHESLEAQRWLLDNLESEPSRADLDNIWSVLRRVSGSPESYSQRMLNHGAPPSERKCGEGGRFQEIEGSIAQIEAQLAVEGDPAHVAKLKTKLTKLETILADLRSR